MDFYDKVSKYSTGINKTNPKFKPTPSNFKFIENFKEQENAKIATEAKTYQDRQDYKNSVANSYIKKTIGKSNTSNKINNIYSQAKSETFSSIIFELYTKSLLIDEYFVNEQMAQLKNYAYEYITARGGYKLLESAVKNTKSGTLLMIKATCEAVAQEVCDRKMKDFKTCEDKDVLSFDISDSEKEIIDYGKDNISTDEIVKLVKDKVLTVVQDEKNRAKEKDNFFNDIENELINDDSVDADKNKISESYNKMLYKKGKVKSVSLFESIMINSYKEILEYHASTQNMIQSRQRDTVLNYDVNTDMEDVSGNEYHEITFNDIKDSEYDENIDVVDMDKVLAESISKYTIIELFNTLKLEELNYSKTKELIKSLK